MIELIVPQMIYLPGAIGKCQVGGSNVPIGNQPDIGAGWAYAESSDFVGLLIGLQGDELYLPGEEKLVTEWAARYDQDEGDYIPPGGPSLPPIVEQDNPVPVPDDPGPQYVPWTPEIEGQGTQEWVLTHPVVVPAVPVKPAVVVPPPVVEAGVIPTALLAWLIKAGLQWVLQFTLKQYGSEALKTGLAAAGIMLTGVAIGGIVDGGGAKTAIYYRGRLVGWSTGSIKGKVQGRTQEANNLIKWVSGWATPGSQI